MKVSYEGKVYEFPDGTPQPEVLGFFEQNGVRLKAAGNLRKMAEPAPPAAPHSPSLPGAIGSALKQASSQMVSSAAALPAAGMRLLEEGFNEEGNFRPFYGGRSLVQPEVFGASDMQPAKPGVPLFAGRQDIPRTSGPRAPLQRFADESRMGLQEMSASDPYDQRLVGKTPGQILSDPIAVASMAGKALPLLASMLGAGVVGGPGAAGAVGAGATIGQEFQGARALEDQGGGPVADAAQRALVSGSLQGALDLIPVERMLKPAAAAAPGILAALRRRVTHGAGTALGEMATEPSQGVVSDILAPGPRGVNDISQLPGAIAQSATDPQRILDAALGALVGGGMGTAIGRPEIPPAPVAAPQAPLADLGDLNVPGPVLQKGATQAPIPSAPPAAPTTGIPREAGPIVTEGERARQIDERAAATRQTVPEGPGTIELQLQGVLEGSRPGVYLPPGSPLPAVIPQGLAVVTRGQGPNAATLFYDPRKTSAAAAQNAIANDRSIGAFLGKAVDGYPAPGAPPAAVVTRAQDGTEIDATEVDSRVPGQVEAETAAQQAKAPGQQTGIEDPTFTKFDRWLANLGRTEEPAAPESLDSLGSLPGGFDAPPQRPTGKGPIQRKGAYLDDILSPFAPVTELSVSPREEAPRKGEERRGPPPTRLELLRELRDSGKLPAENTEELEPGFEGPRRPGPREKLEEAIREEEAKQPQRSSTPLLDSLIEGPWRPPEPPPTPPPPPQAPPQDILAPPSGPEAPIPPQKAGRGRRKAAEPPPAPVDPGPGQLFTTPLPEGSVSRNEKARKPAPGAAAGPTEDVSDPEGPLFRENDPNVTAGGTLMQFPNGRWGFFGRVRGDLGYVRKDGTPATPEDLAKARSFGPDVAGVKIRSFATREEALAALESGNERAPSGAPPAPEAQRPLEGDRDGGNRGADAPLGPNREGGPPNPEERAGGAAAPGGAGGVEAANAVGTGAEAGRGPGVLGEIAAAASRVPTTAGDEKKRADAADWLREASRALADAKRAKEAAEPGTDRARAAERRIWGAEDDLRAAERSAKTAGFNPEELLREGAPPPPGKPQAKITPDMTPAQMAQAFMEARAGGAVESFDEWKAREHNELLTGTESDEMTVRRKPGKYGRESVAKTPDGTQYRTRFRLAEAEDVIPSHDDDLNERPDYDQSNQPRDREKFASLAQVNDIATKMNPPELGDSPLAKDGAPIVDSKNQVLSGNGRTIATQRVYKRRMPGAEAYRRWLRENAEDFGFRPEDVDAMKAPFLVREIDEMTPEARRRFAENANARNELAMSAAEQARIDAGRVTPELLLRFQPGEDGSLLGDKNLEFVQGFLRNVVGGIPGDLLDKQGRPTKALVDRMRAAVFARAYGDPAVLERITESTDDNMKLVSAALVRAAPAFAKAKGAAERGEAHSIDVTPDVAQAAETFSRLRADGVDVNDYLRDPRSVKELSDEARIILSVFRENRTSGKRMGNFLKDLAARASGEGDIRQESMFGDEDVAPPTKREIVEGAARAIGNSLDVDADPHGQESLFLRGAKGIFRRAKDIIAPPPPGGDIFTPEEVEAANKPPAGRKEAVSRRPLKEGAENRLKPGEGGTARTEIMKFVEKGLKTLVRGGRMAGMGADTKGVYIVPIEVIREKKWGDLRTLAHETGHALSKVLTKAGKGWTGAPHVALKDLNRLGVELYGKGATVSYNEEGFAEYAALRIRGEDVMEEAPEFHRWYEANAPESEKQFLDDLADLYDKWDRMGSVEREKSKIHQEPHGFAADVAREAKETKGLFTREELIDKYAELEKVTKEMAKSLGISVADLPPSLNPFLTATAWEGGAPGVVEGMVGRKMVDTEINTIGKGLAEVLEPITKGLDRKATDNKLLELQAFTLALRTLERVKLGQLPLSSVRESEEVVKRLDSPAFRKAAKELTEWNRGMNVWRVQSGLATQEQVDKWEAANPVYVPGKRFFDPDENPQISAGHGPKGFTGQTHGAKRVTSDASNRPFVAPLDAMVEEAQRTVTAAHKQMVFSALVKLAKRTSKKFGHQLVRRVPITKVPEAIRLETIAADLKKAGANLEEADMDAILEVWKNAERPDTRDPILPYRNADGEIEWYEVDPRIYRAMTQTEYQSPAAQRAGRVFGAMKRGVTLGATGLSPSFWRSQVFLADPMSAAVFAKHAPRNPLSAFKGLFDAGLFSDSHKTEAADTFVAAGGKLAGLVASNRAEAGKLWRRAIGEQGRFARFMNKVELLEAGPRIKEFEAAFEYGMKKWGNRRDALTYALVQAKDLTTNFTRSGFQGKQWNQSLPFFNPALQSADKLYRTLTEEGAWKTGGSGRRYVAAAIANITIPSLLLWAFNKDQEWYKELTDEEKDRFWHVGDDRGYWFTLRKPFTTGQIFGSLPVVVGEALLETHDAAGVNKELREIAKGLAPNTLVFPAIQTPLELLGNFKSFPDYEPIVPSYMQSGPSAVLPKDRKRENTLPAAVKLGELTGTSPLKWEHGLNAATGGLATRTLRYGSDLLDIATGERLPALTDIPGLGSALNTKTRQGRSVEDLYQAADELSQKRNSGEEVDEARLEILNAAIKDLRDLRKTPGLSRQDLAAQTTALARQALEEAKVVQPRMARKASKAQPDILAP